MAPQDRDPERAFRWGRLALCLVTLLIGGTGWHAEAADTLNAILGRVESDTVYFKIPEKWSLHNPSTPEKINDSHSLIFTEGGDPQIAGQYLMLTVSRIPPAEPAVTTDMLEKTWTTVVGNTCSPALSSSEVEVFANKHLNFTMATICQKNKKTGGQHIQVNRVILAASGRTVFSLFALARVSEKEVKFDSSHDIDSNPKVEFLRSLVDRAVTCNAVSNPADCEKADKAVIVQID